MSEPAAPLGVAPAAVSGSANYGLRELSAVIALGITLRALHWSALLHLPPFVAPDVDAHVYDAFARRVASGDLGLGREVLPLAPGYFYALGGMYKLFGAGPWGFRLVQAGFGLLLIAGIFDCVRRLYGSRWAAVAGVIAALYGPYAFFETVQLADALGAALHGFLLWFGVRLLTERSQSAAAAARGLVGAGVLGFAWGLCVLVRPNALLLLAPLVWLLWVWRGLAPEHRGLGYAAFCLSALLAFTPSVVRNRAAGDQGALTSLGGLNLYIGNGPGATGVFRVPAEVAAVRGIDGQFAAFARAAEKDQGRALSAREVDGYWYARTWSRVLQAPLSAAGLWLKKLHLFWNGRELWDVYDYGFYQQLDRRLLLGVQYAHLVPLGLLGTCLLWLRGRRAERWVAGFNTAICVAISLVFVSARFRLPIVAGLIVATTCTLRAIALQLRDRDTRGLLQTTLVLLVCMAIAWPVRLKASHLDEEYFKVGAGYHARGDLQDAIWAYDQSLTRNPDHLPSRFNLAQLYQRIGQPKLAAQHFRAAAALAARLGDTDTLQRARARLHALAPSQHE